MTTDQLGSTAETVEQDPQSVGEVLGRFTMPEIPPEVSEERERIRAKEAEDALENKRRVLWNHVVASVGRRYAFCRAKNFEFSPDPEIATRQRDVISRLEDYAENIDENVKMGRGVVFYGPTGTGKDHLLVALMRRATQFCIPVEWRNGVTLFADVRDSFDSERSESSVAAELIKPDVLAISDPLPPFGNLTQFQSTFLFSVLDARYRQLKPTWVTSNFKDGAEAADRMGVQIIERLKDQSLALHCNWPSYRKPSQAK